DLVDLEVADGLDLHLHDLLELLDEEERGSRARVAAAAADERVVTGGLALEHLADALGLGLVAVEDGVGLAARAEAGLLGVRGREDLGLPLVDLLADDLAGGEALAL